MNPLLRLCLPAVLGLILCTGMAEADAKWSYVAGSPPSRTHHRLVYDDIRNQTILYGGGPVSVSDERVSWAWDGNTWRKDNLTTTPFSRTDFGIAYDSTRHRTVFFGGNDGGRATRDTWERAATEWVRLAPATSPILRDGHALAFDAARGCTVLFGGCSYTYNEPMSFVTSTTYLNDTWTWNGTNWLRQSPETSPPARHFHNMVYDSLRQTVVLFGGADATGHILNDTWEWDGVNWTKRSPADSPSVRVYHAMVYDPVRGLTVLYGGSTTPDGSWDTGLRDDTWEWDGTNWSKRTPADTPGARQGSAMAFDPVSGKVLLWGGTNSPTDLWGWNGTNWECLNDTIGLSDGAMCFDTARKRLVLFGGSKGMFMGETSRTLEFDGAKWLRRDFAISPSPRQRHTMVYDAARGKSVLFGGAQIDTTVFNRASASSETWVYNGAAWSKMTPTTAPIARYVHAMAYDSVRQRAVLFGGHSSGGLDLNDTWEWDGTTWVNKSPGVSPRCGHAMAYDSAQGRVILFGGWGYLSEVHATYALDDTWAWDGSDWILLNPAHKPPARGGHAMAYDPNARRIILTGGVTSNYQPDDSTWEWDGYDWVQREATANLSGVSGRANAFDGNLGHVVVFGGGMTPPDELWAYTYERRTGVRPSDWLGY